MSHHQIKVVRLGLNGVIVGGRVVGGKDAGGLPVTHGQLATVLIKQAVAA